MNISDFFTKVDKLSVQETRDLFDEDGSGSVTLLDVREPAEYEEGHIPGALFLPLSNLLNNLDKLDTDRPVVTYCKRGPRSKSAAVLLKRQGFDNVSYMEGGIDAWNGLVARGHYDAGMVQAENIQGYEDFVVMAWALEDGTARFYWSLRDLTKDDQAKGLFETLIRAEEHHKARLLTAYKHATGSDISSDLLQDKSEEKFMEGGISIDSTLAWIEKHNSSLQDILEISMQLETNSLDFYMKMMHEPADERATAALSALIEEEKEHLSQLGNLLGSKFHQFKKDEELGSS